MREKGGDFGVNAYTCWVDEGTGAFRAEELNAGEKDCCCVRFL